MSKTRKKRKKSTASRKLTYLSPFRYPGGKSWFLWISRTWLKQKRSEKPILVEPFGGGAGVSLDAASQRLVRKAVFSELDEGVAATWNTILNGHAEWLARRVMSFRVNRTEVKNEIERTVRAEHCLAFQCLVKNRTARGGVIAPGAGLIREGEAGKGIHSRWYPETLSARITAVAKLRHRLRFHQRDAFWLIRKYKNSKAAIFFVDPPYTKAARRLYQHWEIDHDALFKLLSEVEGDVLMTYDDTEEVRQWAEKYGFKVKTISMRITHHTKKSELMISRSFEWFEGEAEKSNS